MLNKEGQRALVYLSNVDRIEPITFLNSEGELEECSGIEKLVTGGWNMIVKKGVFNKDELFVYCETDTILPVDIPLFSFLEGKRIRTKKLKGVVSQGVCFTIPEILDVIYNRLNVENNIEGLRKYDSIVLNTVEEGDDWTELVGAIKYDEYSNNGKKGDGVKLSPANAKGKFPSFIPKTDEERIQNLAKELKYDWQGTEVVITEKLDGSSITLYVNKDENLIVDGVVKSGYTVGICSRNLELKLNDDNHFCNTGKPILADLVKYCTDNSRSLALQGEIIGPGIQGNPYKLTEHKIYFFNVYDVDAKKRLTHNIAYNLIEELGLYNVPYEGTFELTASMEEAIILADGVSVLNDKTNREGVVVRALDGSFSFKVISNKWLLKEKE